MADNVTLPGAAEVVAADDIAGVKYQRVKVGYGADGSFTDQDAKIATEATLAAVLTIADFDTKSGALTETAPASDTASSGLNGRLQRIAQNITSLIAKFTAGAASVTKNEDVASANADTGVAVLAVRKATPADTSGTDGDYEFLQIKSGRLWASSVIDTALPAGTALLGKVGIDQTTPGTTDHVTNTAVATEVYLGFVGGKTTTVWVEKIRTADTNVYIANDAIDVSVTVPTALTFAVGRIATGTGVIVDAHIATDQVANVSAYELDLYSDTIAYPNDNAEALRSYTNAGKFLGTIVFPAVAKKSTNSTQAESVPASPITVPFKCVGSSNIFGVLRTVTGFTPASGQKFTVRLTALAD